MDYYHTVCKAKWITIIQYVRLNGLLSSAIRTNTGAPQGTVSPFLFVADCRSTNESCPVVKSADIELVEIFFFVMMKMHYITSRLKTV